MGDRHDVDGKPLSSDLTRQCDREAEQARERRIATWSAIKSLRTRARVLAEGTVGK